MSAGALAAAGAGVFAGAFVLAHALGARRWRRETAALHARLAAAREAGAADRYDAATLGDLPPPVQRYFRAALTDGQPRVRAVELRHRGHFNIGRHRDTWKPFHASQCITIRPPGFVWDARIAMMPGLAVRVHDAYLRGEGVLAPALLGLVPLGTLRGGAELARAEAMRYLAEAAWYPTALLPGEGVTWNAVDDTTARATLRDGAVHATLLFRFGPDGLITAVEADGRPRRVGDRFVETPWQGAWFEYTTRDGMRVPQRGEVAWRLPGGPKAYWRAQITQLAYAFANTG